MPEKRIFSVIVIFVVINLIQGFFTPISEDEAYYWLWSQHLDWGYFDHPPMVAWWISIGYQLSQNELGVRLLTIFANSFSIYFLWKILQPETQKQLRLFGVILGSVLVFQVFGFLTTPDAPLLFFTVLYLFSLKNFLEKNSAGTAILLSISFAGLMYSKYHGILVILFTLIPILKTWWKNPKFYLAVLGGFILYLPHIFWLFQNDFIPVRYHFLERSSDEHFEFEKLFNYLGIYFFGCAPFLSYFIFNSIYRFRFKNPFWKSVWWLAVLPGIFFFVSIFKDNVQPQWLLISFLAMAMLMYFHYAERENLKWVFTFGIAGVILVLILRILIVLPEISPLYKNEKFGLDAGKFNVENAVFEKYQEASVYKFFNPEKNVAVHRTLGNRKSQFSLWNWEENFYGKNVIYISPWIKGANSFKGYKNRDYFLKEIQDYETFHQIKIKTLSELNSAPGEKINLGVKIFNRHNREIEIGGNSNLQFNVNFYLKHQYEVIYSQKAEMGKIILSPGEELDIQISFKNIEKSGNYKFCVGINNSQIGTTYVSNVVEMIVK